MRLLEWLEWNGWNGMGSDPSTHTNITTGTKIDSPHPPWHEAQETTTTQGQCARTFPTTMTSFSRGSKIMRVSSASLVWMRNGAQVPRCGRPGSTRKFHEPRFFALARVAPLQQHPLVPVTRVRETVDRACAEWRVVASDYPTFSER